MKILAVGDVHGQQHLEAFTEKLLESPPVDLVLLGGDITERNDLAAFGLVLEPILDHADAPIVSIFGNEEWSESHDAYRESFPIIFLHDESTEVRVGSESIRIVGSTGSLETPTWWQRTNLPNIHRTYAERITLLDRLLDTPGFRLLLTHYAPTYRTLVGEGESWWDQLGSKRMEQVLLRRRPELVVHAHAHKGIPYVELRTEQSTLEDYARARVIPVYNVAFPVRRDVTILEVTTS